MKEDIVRKGEVNNSLYRLSVWEMLEVYRFIMIVIANVV